MAGNPAVDKLSDIRKVATSGDASARYDNVVICFTAIMNTL